MSTLKRLGLEKEFSNWMKSMKNRIHVGDRVEIIKVGNIVTIPKYAKGTVRDFATRGSDNFVIIDFDNVGKYTLYDEPGRFRKVK